MVVTEMAVVYWGGGRRWLTKPAAFRAEARKKIRERCECEKGDSVTPDYTCHYHDDEMRYQTMVRRLARLHAKAFAAASDPCS